MGWGSIGKAFKRATKSVKKTFDDTNDAILSTDIKDLITDPFGESGALQGILERPYNDFSEVANEYTLAVADALGVETDSHIYRWMNDLSGLTINQGIYDSLYHLGASPVTGTSDDFFGEVFASQQTGTHALPGVSATKDLANMTDTNPMPYLPVVSSIIGKVVGYIYGDGAGAAAGASAALSFGIIFGERDDSEYVYMSTLYAALKSSGGMLGEGAAELIDLDYETREKIDRIVEGLLAAASTHTTLISMPVYRRRSNIIGTGLQGLTIE